MQVLKWLFYIFLIGVAGFLVIDLGPDTMNKRCANKWKDSGLGARFTFGTGCMVEVDGRWVPEANVQISLKFKLEH
jgi:hypothetical protein